MVTPSPHHHSRSCFITRQTLRASATELVPTSCPEASSSAMASRLVVVGLHVLGRSDRTSPPQCCPGPCSRIDIPTVAWVTAPAGSGCCNRTTLGNSQGRCRYQGRTTLDSNSFDGLTRVFAGGASRRGLLGALGMLTMGGAALALVGQSDAEAKRKKHKKQKGKTQSPNQNQDPTPTQDQCVDGIKNGAESDVDCGGGTCPRCQGGQICNSR